MSSMIEPTSRSSGSFRPNASPGEFIVLVADRSFRQVFLKGRPMTRKGLSSENLLACFLGWFASLDVGALGEEQKLGELIQVHHVGLGNAVDRLGRLLKH